MIPSFFLFFQRQFSMSHTHIKCWFDKQKCIVFIGRRSLTVKFLSLWAILCFSDFYGKQIPLLILTQMTRRWYTARTHNSNKENIFLVVVYRISTANRYCSIMKWRVLSAACYHIEEFIIDQHVCSGEKNTLDQDMLIGSALAQHKIINWSQIKLNRHTPEKLVRPIDNHNYRTAEYFTNIKTHWW